jgi:DNA polymerase (family 10)
MEEPAGEMSEEALMALPGIGKAIAGKIQELNATGKLAFLEKLETEIPPALINLLAIPDVGAKKAALFWRELGITSLDELETAAREGKLHDLPGIGEKTEARILKNISLMKSGKS